MQQKIIRKLGTVQRPCFSILHRCLKCHEWQSDFRGRISTEDGHQYTIGVSIGITREGEDFLRLYMRRIPLQKTAVTPGRLEVVK
jgi:hypothetical protein